MSEDVNELIADIKERMVFLKEIGVTDLNVDISLLTRAASAESPENSRCEVTALDNDPSAGRKPPSLPNLKFEIPEKKADRPPGSRLASLPSLKDLTPTSSTPKQQPKIEVVSEHHDVIETIPEIRAEIGPDCTRCKLSQLGRSKVVNSVGNFNADLMFVGEAPGADEDEQGEPFVGRAGKLLTDIMNAIGFQRDDVFIGNINRCRPPKNRAPEPDESVVCKPFLLREVAVVRPKVIVVLGATAAQNLLETKVPIGKLRGHFHDYQGSKVMPTFHPAYLLRDPHKKREVWEDMKMVRDYLNANACRAEIVAIGSELLTPDRTDTNSLWLTRELNDLGIEVMLKTVVGDDGARLEEAVSDALRRSDIVITTGGLGPTEDDITREFTAKAIRRELVYHEDIETHLRERFRNWGREMPEINKRQAYVIDGATVLPNPNGSAVGMMVENEGKVLAILPGPPRENQPMFTDYVLPSLKKSAGEVYVSRRVLKVSGLGESAVDEIAAPIYTKYKDVQTSILFNKSEVEIHVAARARDAESAMATTDKLAVELAAALGKAVFSTNGESMEAVVGRLLKARNETLAVAESCTGGLIAQRLTEISGSSAFFMEGAVTYSNVAKMRTLGVDERVLRDHGAVSVECAEAMAVGMRSYAATDHAISVTGIAGPDGGTDEKPVGTVFLGYASKDGVRSLKIVLPGDRYLIRWRASQAALDVLRRELIRSKYA